MLVTVLWRDASISTEEEATPETVKGLDDPTQILETCGWFLGVKDSQVLLATDACPEHADPVYRTITRIPQVLVLDAWRWSRGRPESSMVKGASAPGQTAPAAAGRSGSKSRSSNARR